jgi:integrase
LFQGIFSVMVTNRKLRSEHYTSGEKALTRQEYDKLLSVITDLQDELLIRMAVATGLRREDLCDIKVADIVVPEKRLRFYEAKKKKWREIDLPDSVIVTMQKYWNMLDKKEREREYLFNFVGRTAYTHFNNWCRVAGIPERPFHALRATCTKFAHDAGWTDEQISKLTGDRIDTIQLHYRTPSVGEMAQVTQNKSFA